MDIFRIELERILPSQLYISEQKYGESLALFRRNGFEHYPPIPIKKIGHDIFFTDGHTRALILWQNGVRTVNIYHCPEELDWISYLMDLEWCRNSRIVSIQDLDRCIIAGPDYEKKWLERCADGQRWLAENPVRDLKLCFETDREKKSVICAEVLRSLPKWFGIEAAIQDYVREVTNLHFVSATLYGKVIGFCAVKVNFETNADLFVLGLFEEFHGKGIGTRMIDFVQTYCREMKIDYMSVKTLSARHPDENYRETRKFYERCGFRPFEEFPTLWDEANPCLLMIKNIYS